MRYFQSDTYSKWLSIVHELDLKQMSSVTKYELDLFFANVSLCENPKILDMGCGSGYITAYIANYYNAALALGIDKDLGAIINAKNVFCNNDKVSFLYLNYEMYPMKEKYYDLICFIDSLVFLPHDDIDYILNRCLKALNNTGKIAIFWSSYPITDTSAEVSDDSPIKKWSIKHKLKLKSLNLTKKHKEYWIKGYHSLLNLKKEFLNEIPNEYSSLLKEYEYWFNISKEYKGNWIYRFMYIIENNT